jgi:DNA-binding Lrp family transcriptional regulator
MDFMDEIDKKILTQLQDNCALTNHELATLVHVSPATCMRRVKKLVQNGVIECQIAILSPEKLGAGLTAIVEISLDRQSAEALEDFERRVLNEPALQQCYRVSPWRIIMLWCIVCLPLPPMYAMCAVFSRSGAANSARGWRYDSALSGQKREGLRHDIKQDADANRPHTLAW